MAVSSMPSTNRHEGRVKYLAGQAEPDNTNLDHLFLVRNFTRLRPFPPFRPKLVNFLLAPEEDIHAGNACCYRDAGLHREGPRRSAETGTGIPDRLVFLHLSRVPRDGAAETHVHENGHSDERHLRLRQHDEQAARRFSSGISSPRCSTWRRPTFRDQASRGSDTRPQVRRQTQTFEEVEYTGYKANRSGDARPTWRSSSRTSVAHLMRIGFRSSR